MSVCHVERIKKTKKIIRSSSSALGRLQDCTFRTVQIDHKGHLYPSSADFELCFVVVDSFSRFIQVYPAKSTSALHTIEAMDYGKLDFNFWNSPEISI